MNFRNTVTIPPSEESRYPDFLQEKLRSYYEKRVAQSWKGEHILGSVRPGENALVFQSNDYLCLSRHPLVIQQQQHALSRFGNNHMQSPVFLSHSSLFLECEAALAQWTRYPDCLLFQSGWCANIGLIQSIAKRGLPIYIDYYAHMSLWEGIHSARAKAVPFPHNNIKILEKKIKTFGAGIIIVDSVYSTTGTIAPLEDICALAKAYHCISIVDESHALGIYGPNGAGMVAEKNLTPVVDLITASLAKTLAGRAGMIVGTKAVIEMIRYNAFPTIFSTALMPHDLMGFLAALKVLHQESWRAKGLKDLGNFFRERLLSENIYICDSQTHIIPLLCGTEQQTIWLRQQLEQREIFGSVFCSPATPANRALIRLSLNCNHSEEQLQTVVQALVELKKKHPGLKLFTIPTASP